MGSKNSLPTDPRGDWHIDTSRGVPEIVFGYYQSIGSGKMGSKDTLRFIPTRKPKGQTPPDYLKQELTQKLNILKQQRVNHEKRIRRNPNGTIAYINKNSSAAQSATEPPVHSINSNIIEKKNRISKIKNQIAGYEFNLTGCDNTRSLLESSRNELKKLVDELKQLETKGGSRKTRKNRKQKPHRARTASRKR